MTGSDPQCDALDDLRQRWLALWQQLGVATQRVPDLRPLLEAYQSPDRYYHTLQHIRHCLRELDFARGATQDPAAVELAIWFHDAIYDATRHDNEERSAERMAEVLRVAGSGEALIDRVSALILSTKHAQPPSEGDAQLLDDIDLSIFGQSVEEFDAYERAIRLEYQHVPSDAFRAGRAAVLRKFIERPHIYFTPSFRERYEWTARRNLQRSIERLA